MRPDDINPRTGLVVALVSVFLVFGFMFTVSGIKGETLGDIPLLAIGPAICLPGIAAIALTRKTDGCTKWPQHRCCPPCSTSSCSCCCCCQRKEARDKDALELLRTPSDLESGKGSCGELAAAKAALPTGCAAITTIAASSSSFVEDHQVLKEGKVLLGYLEKCSPEMPGNVLVVEEEEEEEANPSYIRAFLETPPDQSTTVIPPSDTIIVCSYKETSSSPYDRYCCYVNPSQDQEEEVCSDHDDDDVV